jgi:hypothetical protein
MSGREALLRNATDVAAGSIVIRATLCPRSDECGEQQLFSAKFKPELPDQISEKRNHLVITRTIWLRFGMPNPPDQRFASSTVWLSQSRYRADLPS